MAVIQVSKKILQQQGPDRHCVPGLFAKCRNGAKAKFLYVLTEGAVAGGFLFMVMIEPAFACFSEKQAKINIFKSRAVPTTINAPCHNRKDTLLHPIDLRNP